MLEVGARRRLGLGGARGLLDPEQLRLDGIGGGLAQRGDVDGGVARRVCLVLKPAGGGHGIRAAGLGERADDADEVDLGRGLLRAVAAKGELHDHELVARLAGDHERRAVGVLGEGMRRLPLSIEGEHGRGERQVVVLSATGLERDAVERRRRCVTRGGHHDVHERRVADVGGVGRRVVERNGERDLLADQGAEIGPVDRGRWNRGQREPVLEPLGLEAAPRRRRGTPLGAGGRPPRTEHAESSDHRHSSSHETRHRIPRPRPLFHRPDRPPIVQDSLARLSERHDRYDPLPLEGYPAEPALATSGRPWKFRPGSPSRAGPARRRCRSPGPSASGWSKPTLRATNVAVTSARTQTPPAVPVSQSIPDGRSTTEPPDRRGFGQTASPSRSRGKPNRPGPFTRPGRGGL